MKPILCITVLTLTLLAEFAAAHDATYCTEYTNASTQLSLDLSPTEAVYWDGSSISLRIAGSGYECPDGMGPGASLLINCLIDGTEIATTSFTWGCYYANRVTNAIPLRDLAVGAHTVTVQHTNSFEYNVRTLYSYTSSHTYWGRTYYHTYYNRIHYWTVPCSASKTLTVKPSPNFRKLHLSLTNNSVALTYTGIPTNNYGIYFSFDLRDWHLLAVRKTSTNGVVQFGDNYYPGPFYYRVYGP